MNTTTLPAPSGTSTDGMDDDFEHLWCCDPDRALCGADLSEDNDVGDADLEAPCPMCEALEEINLPCGAKGCAG